MSSWIINQCLIISYEIKIFPMINSTETNLHRSYIFENNFQHIQIDNLQANQDYQLHIRVNSQAGEIVKIISFRTTNENNQATSKMKNYYIIILIVVISFIFTLISSIIVFILIKFCRLHLKKTGKYEILHANTINNMFSFLDLFLAQTRKLKPVICASYPHHYHSTWLKSNNEFTMQNYTNNTRPYSYASGMLEILFV